MKTLQQMANEVWTHNTNLGWEPDPDRSFGDEIALIHSEVSEALEAYREVRLAGRTNFVRHTPSCEFSDMAYQLECSGCEMVGKPDDVPSEFADILIRLLHYSTRYDIDLEAEYERKMKYNRTRAWRHGGKVM